MPARLLNRYFNRRRRIDRCRAEPDHEGCHHVPPRRACYELLWLGVDRACRPHGPPFPENEPSCVRDAASRPILLVRGIAATALHRRAQRDVVRITLLDLGTRYSMYKGDKRLRVARLKYAADAPSRQIGIEHLNLGPIVEIEPTGDFSDGFVIERQSAR